MFIPYENHPHPRLARVLNYCLAVLSLMGGFMLLFLILSYVQDIPLAQAISEDKPAREQMLLFAIVSLLVPQARELRLPGPAAVPVAAQAPQTAP